MSAREGDESAPEAALKGESRAHADIDSADRDLHVFVGYQFTSTLASRTTLLDRIVEGIERVESDVNTRYANSLQMRLKRLDLVSAKAMGTQILEAINESDICIFELSDMNANVLFEMGYAAGRGKMCAYLLHWSVNIDSLPSDIRQDYVEQYREDRLDIKLGKQLKLILEEMYPELTIQ